MQGWQECQGRAELVEPLRVSRGQSGATSTTCRLYILQACLMEGSVQAARLVGKAWEEGQWDVGVTQLWRSRRGQGGGIRNLSDQCAATNLQYAAHTWHRRLPI